MSIDFSKEYLDVIGPLSDPKANGSEGPAFHLVIPSLPGFGFGGPTTDRGWGCVRTAAAWKELMARLGYERYGPHGNDGGSMISPQVGRIDGDRVIGLHVNQIFSFPSGDPAEMEGMSAEELAGLEVLGKFWEEKGAFNVLHSQQPQTLAHALADSPVGLLAWLDQLMDDAVSDDFVLEVNHPKWRRAVSSAPFSLPRNETRDPSHRHKSRTETVRD